MNGWKDPTHSGKIQEGKKFRVLEGRSMMAVRELLADGAREAGWEQTVKHLCPGIRNLDYIQYIQGIQQKFYE